MKASKWFRMMVLVAGLALLLAPYYGATGASSDGCISISGTCPAQTAAAEVNTLGYGFFGDSVYKISCTIPHSASSLGLSFTGSLTEGIDDESWGLDNVVVSVNGTEVFNNDFETNVGPGWSDSSTDTTPSGRVFLGQFGSETVSLSLNNLPAHTSVTVSFCLFIIQSWDGNDLTNSGFGPDQWSFSADGSSLLSATFSNVTDPDHTQTFCPGEGCTPGYWKNHPESWGPSGLSTGQAVSSVFTIPACLPSCGLGSATLLQALSFKGGSDDCGAAQILLRAAVAARLNASHPGVNYPRTPAQVVADVNSALASCNRDTILSLATALDNDNNLGCPF